MWNSFHLIGGAFFLHSRHFTATISMEKWKNINFITQCMHQFYYWHSIIRLFNSQKNHFWLNDDFYANIHCYANSSNKYFHMMTLFLFFIAIFIGFPLKICNFVIRLIERISLNDELFSNSLQCFIEIWLWTIFSAVLLRQWTNTPTSNEHLFAMVSHFISINDKLNDHFFLLENFLRANKYSINSIFFLLLECFLFNLKVTYYTKPALKKRLNILYKTAFILIGLYFWK